eukprot:scaffold48414_cov78-Phaeocystis_antarctica.AAC.1
MRRHTPVTRTWTHAAAFWPPLEESVSVLARGWVVGYSDEMNFQPTKIGRSKISRSRRRQSVSSSALSITRLGQRHPAIRFVSKEGRPLP